MIGNLHRICYYHDIERGADKSETGTFPLGQLQYRGSPSLGVKTGGTENAVV